MAILGGYGQVHTHTYTHSHTQTQTHTSIHTHTHTRTHLHIQAMDNRMLRPMVSPSHEPQFWVRPFFILHYFLTNFTNYSFLALAGVPLARAAVLGSTLSLSHTLSLTNLTFVRFLISLSSFFLQMSYKIPSDACALSNVFVRSHARTLSPCITTLTYRRLSPSLFLSLTRKHTHTYTQTHTQFESLDWTVRLPLILLCLYKPKSGLLLAAHAVNIISWATWMPAVCRPSLK
jgi:hypothetical protein